VNELCSLKQVNFVSPFISTLP